MKELDYYYSALFQQSNRIEYVRYILLIATVISLSYSVYANGYHLYAATIIALLFQVTSWYLKTKMENVRYLANEFHKISMLYRAYNKIPSEFQLSHLKALVSKSIFSEVEKKIKTDDLGAEYNIINNGNSREILMSLIHENSYWNHHLYKSVFMLLVGGVSVVIIALTITSLFALPLIKIDPNYTVPRLAFTFLSFSLLYEVLEKSITSYNSSIIMLEIDNELSRCKNISEEHLLKVFNQFCYIRETAPDVPFFIYESNKDRLNSGWESRVEMSK